MKLHVFLASILSGVLLWLAFFPANLGPIAFFAMAPFLTLVRAEGIGPWRRYFAAFLGGFTFSMLALNWITVAHPMMAAFAWPSLSVYNAIYWPIGLFLLRKMDRAKLPLVVAFPVVWVALEYFRAHFPTGFPFLQSLGMYQLSGFGWYFLGYTQHANLPLLQTADLGGVYIISAAVAAVNVAVMEWLLRSKIFRFVVGSNIKVAPLRYTREMNITAVSLGFTLLLVLYGSFRLVHKPFEQGPRVALLQGDVPQDQKNQRGEFKEGDATPLDKVYRDTLAVGASQLDPQPDLIIWPETCWADNWYATAPDVPPPENYNRPEPFAKWVQRDQQFLAKQVIDKTQVHALIGLNCQEWTGTAWRKGNTAILIRPDAQNYFGGRYDKMHLVPFGEYVPFRQTFPWLKNFTPYEHDYSCTPGEEYTRFELPARPAFRSGKELTKADIAAKPNERIYHFGILICYEDSDPYIARQYNQASGRPTPVDFLVNMSNDGWFTGTEQHEQHLAISRFRAVEARRTLVRAVNMGISAFINPDGRIIALPNGTWETSKGMESRGIVSEPIPLDTRESYYALFGDWVPALMWFVLIVALVRGRRTKPTVATSPSLQPASGS